jgi:hypothetical protein
VTSTQYSGKGAIVEVGPWLGCSTLHLAAGLERSGHQGRITSIDKFVWVGADFEKKAPLGLQRNDDFQPFFLKNVAPLAHCIRSIRSAVEDVVWDGGPIEILFVDAPKRTKAISGLFKAFAASLMPGALVVFQDYAHGPSYQLALAIDHLRRHGEPVHVVTPGASVAFRLTRPIAADAVTEEALGFAGWSAAEAEAVWARIMAPLPEEASVQMSAGLPMLLYDLGHVERACAAMRAIADEPRIDFRMRRWSTTSLAKRYAELFTCIGLEIA